MRLEINYVPGKGVFGTAEQTVEPVEPSEAVRAAIATGARRLRQKIAAGGERKIRRRPFDRLADHRFGHANRFGQRIFHAEARRPARKKQTWLFASQMSAIGP